MFCAFECTERDDGVWSDMVGWGCGVGKSCVVVCLFGSGDILQNLTNNTPPLQNSLLYAHLYHVVAYSHPV